MELIHHWKHVFKLDPDKEISDEALEQVCLSGTDAIIVGGSSGVTFENTVELLARIRRYEVDVALEVTDADAAVPGFDVYLIPFVLNSSKVDWMIGRHQQAVKQWGKMMPWDAALGEGYIILNDQCTAAKISEAECELDAEDVLSYLRIADRLLHLPIVYLEYSGTFGDMKVVQACRQAMRTGRLFYGGGIRSLEQARLAADSSDTIVVGNLVYEDLAEALATVQVKHAGAASEQ